MNFQVQRRFVEDPGQDAEPVQGPPQRIPASLPDPISGTNTNARL